MKKYFVLLVLTPFFVSCASTSKLNAKKSLRGSDKAGVNVEIDDALFGTWDQTSISCSSGEMTKEGKEALASYKSGMAVAKVVVTSDRVFWDMKEYKDVEKPNDFCQVSIEELWSTKGSDQLLVKDSEVLVTGNGQVVCDKKYTYTMPRTHRYKASEKDLSIYLSSAREALTGVATSDQALCKTGEVVLNFVRDSADE